MSTPLTPDSPTGTPNAEKRCVACEKKRRIKALKMCSACYDRDLERRREADGGVLVPIVTSRRRGDLVQCLGCAAEFYRAPSSKYHSLTCFHDHRRRLNTATCARPECGQVFTRPPSQRGRYCSHACYALDKVGTGQGWLNPDGYLMISGGKNRSALLVHRVVAQESLGRELLPGEEIHHINGHRDDNRTDGPFALNPRGNLQSGNLELWVNERQPKGQEPGPRIDAGLELAERFLAELDSGREDRILVMAARVRRMRRSKVEAEAQDAGSASAAAAGVDRPARH